MFRLKLDVCGCLYVRSYEVQTLLSPAASPVSQKDVPISVCPCVCPHRRLVYVRTYVQKRAGCLGLIYSSNGNFWPQTKRQIGRQTCCSSSSSSTQLGHRSTEEVTTYGFYCFFPLLQLPPLTYTIYIVCTYTTITYTTTIHTTYERTYVLCC